MFRGLSKTHTEPFVSPLRMDKPLEGQKRLLTPILFYGRFCCRFNDRLTATFSQSIGKRDVASVQSWWKVQRVDVFICLTSELLAGRLHTAWDTCVCTFPFTATFGNAFWTVLSVRVCPLTAPETRLGLNDEFRDKSASVWGRSHGFWFVFTAHPIRFGGFLSVQLLVETRPTFNLFCSISSTLFFLQTACTWIKNRVKVWTHIQRKITSRRGL